jgi:hypothetical protein
MDLRGAPMSVIHKAKKHLIQENKKFSDELVSIPRLQWPTDGDPRVKRTAVYRNKNFLVQVVIEKERFIRITVNRTKLLDNGDYEGGITWDELMDIKRQCGFKYENAVEVYPKDDNIVNVANMRHLWILKEELPFIWKNSVICSSCGVDVTKYPHSPNCTR